MLETLLPPPPTSPAQEASVVDATAPHTQRQQEPYIDIGDTGLGEDAAGREPEPVSIPGRLSAETDTTPADEPHAPEAFAVPAEESLQPPDSEVYRRRVEERYRGVHRRQALADRIAGSVRSYFGVGTEQGQGNQNRHSIVDTTRAEGRAPARQAFYPQPLHEDESPLAWLINNGARPGDAHESVISMVPNEEELTAQETRVRGGGSTLVEGQLTGSEAIEANKKLTELATMESDVEAGGSLPPRSEVLRRFGLARHSRDMDRQDTEVVEAAMVRLAQTAHKGLVDTVQHFAEQGIAPSKQVIAQKLYPGKKPEELAPDELDYVSVAFRNIADNISVQTATVDSLIHQTKTTGHPPTISRVQDRLFPYKYDERHNLTLREILQMGSKTFDVMATLLRISGWDMAQKVLDRGVKTTPEEVAYTLFGAQVKGSDEKERLAELKGKLSLSQYQTVEWVLEQTKMAGDRTKTRPQESVWSRLKRVARMTTAAGALAVSLVHPVAPAEAVPVAKTALVSQEDRPDIV